MDRPRRGEYGEVRQLVQQQLREVNKYLRGPVSDQIRTQVQSSLSRWTDPRAKLERRKARTAAVAWLFLLAGVVLAVVATIAIAMSPGGVSDVMYGAVVGVFGAASLVLSGRSALRLRALNRVELPAAAPAMPPARSLAREPMERLADAERALAELLRQLGSPRSNVPVDTVQHARDTGVEAAATLREVAGQLQALERARDLAPVRDRGPLDEAVRGLRDQLDEGLDGYGSLIAAAGRLVAASSTGGPDKQALTDASDRLHGLALALRELFPNRG
ncbi:hypothetical protein GCM10029964_102520 [Kibdelosporangium lantanae]